MENPNALMAYQNTTAIVIMHSWKWSLAEHVRAKYKAHATGSTFHSAQSIFGYEQSSEWGGERDILYDPLPRMPRRSCDNITPFKKSTNIFRRIFFLEEYVCMFKSAISLDGYRSVLSPGGDWILNTCVNYSWERFICFLNFLPPPFVWLVHTWSRKMGAALGSGWWRMNKRPKHNDYVFTQKCNVFITQRNKH